MYTSGNRNNQFWSFNVTSILIFSSVSEVLLLSELLMLFSTAASCFEGLLFLPR